MVRECSYCICAEPIYSNTGNRSIYSGAAWRYREMCDWFCAGEKRCMVAEYRKIVSKTRIDSNRQWLIIIKTAENNKTELVKDKLMGY